MSTVYLPKSITKDVLFRRACDRFLNQQKLFIDPKVTAEYMYEDMSYSIFSGSPVDDFPEAFESEPEKPIRISENEFRYRDTVFRVTRDTLDDKSYIWCDKYEDTDNLVWWTWGAAYTIDTWLIGTNMLDKFIDSHKKEQK